MVHQTPDFQQPPEGLRTSNEDAVVFVDLQNLNNFLSSCCDVNPHRLHIVNFVKEWLAPHGIGVADVRIYTGVPDETIDPVRAEAVRKRIGWLHASGAKVFTHKLAYTRDAATGEQRGREKGIDVRLASELVAAVAVGNVRRVVVVSQDRDIVQGLDVARNICQFKGEYLHAYSPVLKDLSRVSHQRCAYWGIPLTNKIEVPLALVDHYCSTNNTHSLQGDPAPAQLDAKPTLDTPPVQRKRFSPA